MADALTIRRFANTDAPAVRDLFIRVNRLLAPPQMKDAFETYIASSISEEIGRIAEYYAARRGSFWVAEDRDRLAGMFGLETAEPGDAMELRRMYVEPELRRQGIARTMLAFAENECRRLGMKRLELSTSELQDAALCLPILNGASNLVRKIGEVHRCSAVGPDVNRFMPSPAHCLQDGPFKRKSRVVKSNYDFHIFPPQ